MPPRRVAVLGLMLLGPLGLLGVTGCAASTAAAHPLAAPPTAAPPSPRASAPTPAPAATASPRTTPRTTAELEKALLTLADVPSGLTAEPDTGGDDGGYSVTSTRSGCASLVRLMNAVDMPGSVANAGIGFDGGSSGPFFGEELDAFRPGGARTMVEEVRTAVRACSAVSMDVDGSGRAPFSVEETSAPGLGQARTAVRFTETDSDDFSFDIVFVSADDVLLSTTGMGSDPADLEGFTHDAYDKLLHGRVSRDDSSDGVGDTGNDAAAGDQPA